MIIVEITKQSTQKIVLTEQEVNEKLAERKKEEEKAQLELLNPTKEEIEKAEFEIKTINLLTELGVIK